MNNLPEVFEDFSEARKQGFITIKNLKDGGKKVVGTFCTFTPWEVIHAAGAVPVSLCAKSDETIADAEKHLPRNLCPLIKSSYGFAITDKCPYFYFSDLIVGETTCDGKKKMYEYLGEIKEVHVMQLPQTYKGEDAYRLWRNEIIRLKEKLQKEFGVDVTKEELSQSIKLRNRERIALKEFYELGKMCPPPITGLEMLKVLNGASFKWDKDEEIRELKDLINRSKSEYQEGQRKVSPDAKRILITGCPMGEATEKIIKAIEENGGAVVCYENCTGIKEISKLVDETIDPIDALTEKYLNIGCSCMSPNDNRVNLLSELIDDYKVDGVIDVILQACHTYSVEAFNIKRFVNDKKKTAYMSIETDYSQTDIGQINTRIAAFIEML
ncbi:double-cubane-cluster-containing anaerobic reductase [Clostridium sp. CX1]|uniref:Double-cubane-cluster-containing anaerobic reductase n=1 Tax=Clostridium tanneri TaxID=3037988 RepID=A0ABU4JQZ7_9CLOT|nr:MULTISPECIES: double-cubane-cluster-containing anaerobic reductase [unclassified Clostridium]MCT8977374.1 double-cubane-cluster-containing anaerobic reductase [Clostridium sp. CX1]MDW8800575.1 double-cubane-cluster-containing anaerobic reductase [Clostridium sp. A1-XYC3]